MDKKIVRVVFTDKESSAIDTLLSHFGINKANDLIRFLVIDKVKDLKEKGMKYGTPGPAPSKIAKAQRDEAFDAFKKMQPDDMTKELIRIGYIIPGELRPGTELEIVRHIEIVDGSVKIFTAVGSSKTSDLISNEYGDIEKAFKKFYDKQLN